MPTDEYIDEMLDAAEGHVEFTLNELLTERELMLTTAHARTTVWRNS